MMNFCTLFDSNYLSRGLTLYESLSNTIKEFHLYVFAFDDLCYNILRELNYNNITPISLSEFEDDELLAAKKTRSNIEYCWTTTPKTIEYVFRKFNLKDCTYLDADLYFFNNPQVIFNEIGEKSIAITEHNYSKKYNQAVNSGIFNVQFMYFKNDAYGLEAINWWKDRCLEWCYARHEDGKFGDQKYLDDWPERFKNVHVIKNPGSGVAPWNIQQYKIKMEGNYLPVVTYINKSYPLIFYHFHAVKFASNNRFDLFNYKLSRNSIKYIYIPYLINLIKVRESLKEKFNDEINFLEKNYKNKLRNIKRFFKGILNVVKI